MKLASDIWNVSNSNIRSQSVRG